MHVANLSRIQPEVLKGDRYTNACDEFSTAMILWEVYNWLEPYQELSVMDVLTGVTRQQMRPPLSRQHIPSDIINIIEQSWTQEPEDRISFKELIQYLTKIYNKYDKMMSN